MSIPVTESDTIHAAQAELERLLSEADDLRFIHATERQLLRLLVIQSQRYADLYDQVQDIEKRLNRMRGMGEEE